MTEFKRLALVTAATAVSLLGCAQVPSAPAPAPEAAVPLPLQVAPSPPEPAPTFPVQPSLDPQPGARRYGGSMGYQGGTNMTSWPDASLREEVWRQQLGPTPALTGRGRWGYAPAPVTEDERPD